MKGEIFNTTPADYEGTHSDTYGSITSTSTTDFSGVATSIYTAGIKEGFIEIVAIDEDITVAKRGSWEWEKKEEKRKNDSDVFGVEIEEKIIRPVSDYSKAVLNYENWRIVYRIKGPDEWHMDSVKIQIKDCGGVLVYQKEYTPDNDPSGDERKTGRHYIEWDGKWNYGDNDNRFADPMKNPYTVKVQVTTLSDIYYDETSIDIEGRALSGSCVFGYGENAEDIGNILEDTGYTTAIFTNISKTQAINNTTKQLVWYCMMHGNSEDMGKWIMRYYAEVNPEDFKSGLNYTLVFANCCYSLVGTHWSEYKNKFNAETFIGWNSMIGVPGGTAAAFGKKFFEYLKEGKNVAQALYYAKEDVPEASQYFPEYKGNGNLKIKFP